MNYQYRYGTSTTTALKTLYSQGGIARFVETDHVCSLKLTL